MADVASSRGRDESTIAVERIVGYVRRVAGDDAVGELIEGSGLAERWAEVADPGGWCTTDEVLAVARAAAHLCKDPDIGRRTGEELVRQQRSDEMGQLLRETGSVEGAVALAVELGVRISTVRTIRLRAVRTGRAELEMLTELGHPMGPDRRFFCGMAAGFFVRLPELFGTVGAVVEQTCQHLGDDRCRFHLVWDEADVDEDAGGSPRAGTIERFEQMQAMAAEIIRPEDVDVILARVVAGIGSNVVAHRTALVVHLPGERRRRTHLLGFADDDPEGVADEVLDGALGRLHEAISVPITSARHDYGWLVAVMAPGTTPSDHERRMLIAYASHVAAALDGITTLAESRRSQATAEGLLALAGALASATDMDEIAHHLVRATTVVTGADQAVVLFWNPDEDAVVARAWLPEDAVYACLSLPRASIPELTGDDSLLPRAVDIPGANPLMAAIMESAGTSHAITVPISAHGEYLGTLVAGYASVEPPVFDAELTARARGLADQTAAALQNVQLLQQIRHQALHDALTGLPNRPLMEDRAQQAIAQAERAGSSVGLLFLDLDRFKVVNDTLGHVVGDELLRAVAARLADVVRSSDTVSRQGGDEFLVLLPNQRDTQAAEHTARKILRELERPFTVAGLDLTISASIGVAWGRGIDASYQELVHRADLAMYQAKESGRNAVAVYEPGDAGPEGGGPASGRP